ncbi:MAG: cupin domain-containing protein [Acidobacteriota bacterium]
MHVSVPQLDPVEVMPGFAGRFVHAERTTLAFWDLPAGRELPVHSHPHEQILVQQSGRFEITVDGETWIAEAGDCVVIPPNVEHSGRSLTDCRILDVFAPVREDYREACVAAGQG